jgi:hypothetical protein
VQRAFANLLLSLLLLASFAWGGCISCEQYFMWPGAKGCCAPDGKCKTKTPPSSQTRRECKQIAFDHQKSVDFHVDLPVVAMTASDTPLRMTTPLTLEFGPYPIDPSPPDLQILHSTFLI